MKKAFFMSSNIKGSLCAAAVAVALAGMASCSEHDIALGGDSETSGIETTTLTVTNDANYLDQYVTNYKARAASRAADDSYFDFVMPAQPAVPESATSLVGAKADNNTINLYRDNYGWNTYSATGEFVVPAGETVNEDLNLAADDITIYIAGTYNGRIVGNNTSCTVHVLGTGEWLSANSDIQPAWTIYKYKGAGFDFAADVTGWKGKIYADELITDVNVTLTNGSELMVEELLKAADIRVNSGALFTAHCVEGNDVYLTNGTDIYISAYINAINLKLDSKTALHMRGAGYINVEKYLMCGNVSKTGAGDMFVNEGLLPCVINTQHYIAQGSNQGDGKCSISGNISGTFDLHVASGAVTVLSSNVGISEIDGAFGSRTDYAIADVERNSDTALVDEPLAAPLYDSCTAAVIAQAPGHTPSTPDPVLDVVSKVQLDHRHPISATCIDVVGNQAFVSWHERGDNMMGCIEVLDITSPNTVTFKAWMQTPRSTADSDKAYDFNHLVYDQRTNSLLTVGDHAKKGGFVSQIKLADVLGSGLIEQPLEVMIPRQLPLAASGNSILRHGDDLYIACAGGYTVFPFGDGERFAIDNKKGDYTHASECTNLPTDGSAKHLAIYGSTLATIEYTTRTGDKRPALISLWDADSWLPGTPASTIPVPDFGPTYGKDVIALDAEYIYSCQGTNGMAVYRRDGSEAARFQVNDHLTRANGFTDEQINKMRHSAANGLCVYGNYVFVANGGAGVWVLDKTRGFAPVGHFTDQEKYLSQELDTEIGASANYVRVTDDGYVYVAYGLGGVMVLKFDPSAIK